MENANLQSKLRRPPLAVIVLVAIALWMPGYFNRGLWEPDEARYAYVAREMQSDGNWFVPHLHGEAYPDKPPLMFWLMNAASLLTGGSINGFSARLPSLLGAILALWATARLMERWLDGAAAWRAIGVLLTAYLFWWQGGWGQIDMLLLGLEMMALWCLFTATDPGCRWRFACAYLFMGLAILAKGPIGLALPLGIYALSTWAGGEARLLRRWHWVWGPALAGAIPGLWLLVAWFQNAPAEYFAAMFGGKSFGRVTGGPHGRPFYYYVSHFLSEFLPWTIFLLPTYLAIESRALRRRLLAWAGFVFVLFSAIFAKRNLYILAMWPAAAMMVAAGWDGMVRLPSVWHRVVGWIAGGLLLCIGIGEAVAMFVDQYPAARWPLAPAALVMITGFAVVAVIYRREGLSRRWFWAYVAVLLVHQMLLLALVLPSMNAIKAPVELASEARMRLAPDQPVYLFQDQLAIIPLYVERPGRYLDTEEEVEQVVAQGRYGVIVLSQQNWEKLGPRFADRVRARTFKMGSKELVWIDFPIAVGEQ